MLALQVRNVEVALREACFSFNNGNQTVIEDSRNGKVKRMQGITATEYRNPWERVLLCPIRDANPFFHFFESLWMIAGRNDVDFPNQFCSDRMSAFSDNGKTLNGAYGARWRRHFGYDQLLEIVSNLERNPTCRRQVLSMWDGREDLLNMRSKDVPCNDMATFQIDSEGYLNMVVFNRSNDLIWGAYGANAVHFSMLHEWMCMHLRCGVGTYTQVSSNTHVYEHHWDMVRRIAATAPDLYSNDRFNQSAYTSGRIQSVPLVYDLSEDTPESWDSDLESFFRWGYRERFRTLYFNKLVVPLYEAFKLFKEGKRDKCDDILSSCRSSLGGNVDWFVAAEQWLQRRTR